jgi:iron complex transport system substrate-binding protein
VVIFNQRSVDEILSMILTLSAMVGAGAKGKRLIAKFERNLDRIRVSAGRFARRPRVYFEEWDDPMISGIRWVSELVSIAGGDDIFPELSRSQGAAGRTIADGAEVVRRAPEVILGSWCGKKFRPERVVARPGWDAIPAVRDRELHEIKSVDILQPGPAALTDGVARMHDLFGAWNERQRD